LGTIKILKKDEDKRSVEREQIIKNMVKAQPPEQPYIENLSYVYFDEGILSLMSDKKMGEPKYDEKNEVLWLGPYIAKNKSEKGTYYLSTMDGRRMALPVDGSLLRPWAPSK
jgi:hypothetical protein